jgi:hypothetical protein
MKYLIFVFACLISVSVVGQGWEQTYGGLGSDYGKSVQQTTDGGYIITGYTDSGNATFDVYLIKTYGNGVEQWSQTYGGTDSEIGRSVQQTTDGGYIITGNSYYAEPLGIGSSDVYLIKTDGNGVEQWSQTYSGPNDGVGYSVQQTTDGGYIITGYTNSFENGQEDVYLIKTDGNGVEQWGQIYGGPNYDVGTSVQQTTDGGYIITGYSFGNGSSDVYLIKTDGNGVEQWSQTYGGTNIDWGYSVQQTTDGGYIITGRTNSFGNGSFDVYLIKTDSEGTLSSSFIIPTPSNRKLEKVVDALGREVNHTTNQILFYIYDDGSVEKKFVVD